MADVVRALGPARVRRVVVVVARRSTVRVVRAAVPRTRAAVLVLAPTKNARRPRVRDGTEKSSFFAFTLCGPCRFVRSLWLYAYKHHVLIIFYR